MEHKDILGMLWKRQKSYSKNANEKQRNYLSTRLNLIILGAATTILSITYSNLSSFPELSQVCLQIRPESSYKNLFLVGNLRVEDLKTIYGLLGFLIILLPIISTTMLDFSSKYNRGSDWIRYRRSSEKIKSQIFFYRTKTGEYSQNRDAVLGKKFGMLSKENREKGLRDGYIYDSDADALKPYEKEGYQSITSRGLITSVIHKSFSFIGFLLQSTYRYLMSIEELRYTKNSNDRPKPSEDERLYTDLNASQYISVRLHPQYEWYRKKANIRSQSIRSGEKAIYVFSAASALIAALGYQSWVSVTATLVAALSTLWTLSDQKLTLKGYNEAATRLYNIEFWFNTLSKSEQESPETLNQLVTITELTIQGEQEKWLDAPDENFNLKNDVVSLSQA